MAENNSGLAPELVPFKNVFEKNDKFSLQTDNDNRLPLYRKVFDNAFSLAKENPAELVSVLLAGLGEKDKVIHQPAVHILRSLSGQYFAYLTYSSLQQRMQGRQRWINWWLSNKNNFRSQLDHMDGSTLIVDEIPGRLHANDDEPPGRLLHLDAKSKAIIDLYNLKMPYDAVRVDKESYWVNIIRARSVYKINNKGQVIARVVVGGYPCSLQVLANGNLLVAGWDDNVPGFVREFDSEGNIVWREENLKWPWKAERLENGNTLIADAGTKRVFELDEEGREVWSVDNLGPEKTELFDQLGPVYAQRLDDGNTLVSIRGISKVVELDKNGEVVWEVGPEIVKNQYSAVRLWNGNTLIADGGNFRIIEITVNREIVWAKDGIGYPAKAYRY